MKMSWKHGVAIAIGGLLLGGTLSAVGQNAENSEEPTVEKVHFRGPGGHKFGGLVRSESIVEGEEDGTFDTVRVDRGELTAVDGNTLMIEEADGESVEVTVNDDTRIGRNGEQAEVGDLEVGDHVTAHRVKEGDGEFVTRHVHAISAERYAEMEAQREACTDDDQSTECERPLRGPGGPGGRRGMRMSDGDVERAPEPALLDLEAA